MPKETGRKLIAQNKKARHDYHLEDVYEAGLVLTGTEVKSLRAGRASLVDAYAHIKDGEAWLENAHIPEYDQGSWTNHEPRRPRKLLLHREQIAKLVGFKDGKAKVEIALARGKRAYDKRQSLAARDAAREIERAVGRRAKGRA